MNKTEFLSEVYGKTNLSKRDCKLCLDAIIQVIASALQSGDSVTLSNFGKFKVDNVKSRPMYSFKTGRTELLEARRVPSFKPSGSLKQSIK